MKVFFSLLVTFPMVWVLISLYMPSGVTVGRAATPFVVSLADGEDVRLKDLRNKVVVVNFWASWCTSCQGEAKVLESVWKKFKSEGVLFLGINVENDDEKDARQYLKKYGITYPSGWDDGSIAKKYNVWGVPKTFIIGPKGTITYVHLGAIQAAKLKDKIGEAQKGQVTAQEGRGPYQSLDVVRIEELARLLESAKHADKQPPPDAAPKEKYRVIDLYALGSHRNEWVKIRMKNGSKREGRVMDLSQDLLELEQRFSAGYFSIQVPMGQIEEVQLLISNGRAGAKQ